MADLADIVEFLDRELRTAEIEDFSGAINGLQLQNKGTIQRVVAAVDASLPVVEKAAAGEPGTLLLVHHGMFWQGAQPLTDAFYRKIKVAMEADMAIYSSHLPLDVHPQWGNNAVLANALGLTNTSGFLDFKGLPLGIQGDWAGSASELKEILERVLGASVHVCPAGPAHIQRIGVATGGAGSEVAKAATQGVDAFITGEGPHWSYTLAEELGLHLFYGGHYATETFGVKALAPIIAKHFGCPWEFLDHPTGL